MVRMIFLLVIGWYCAVASAGEPLPEPEQMEQHQLGQYAASLLNPPITQEFMPMLSWLRQALHFAELNRWEQVKPTIAAPLASLSADFREFEKAKLLLARSPLTGEPLTDMWLIDAKLNVVSFEQDLHGLNETVKQANGLVQKLDGWRQGKMLFSIGRAYYQTKQYDKALEFMKRAQPRLANDNAELYLAQVDNLLANIFYRMGDYLQAEQHYLQLLEIARNKEQPYNETNALYALGLINGKLKRRQQAQNYYEQSAELGLNSQSYDLYVLAQTRLAQLQLDVGDFDGASGRLRLMLNEWAPEQGVTAPLATMLVYLDSLIRKANFSEAESLYFDLEQQLKGKALSEEKVRHLELGVQLAKATDDLPLTYRRLVSFADSDLRWLQQQQQESATWLGIQLEADELRKARKQLELDQALQRQEASTAAETTLLLQVIWILIALIMLGSLLLWWRSKQLKLKLKKQAFEDFLTAAPNRRAILSTAKNALVESQRSGVPLLLACIDLDHFKLVNDRCGHDVGDKLLQAFAKVCRQQLRSNDHFGRIGGEEWLLLLTNAEISQAEDVFERLRQAWMQVRVEGFDETLPLTFSMGAVECSGTDLHRLMKQADGALYQAKQQGRDQLVWAH